MATVHLSLGSNLGDRIANLSAAARGLSVVVEMARWSFVYETAPMYVTDQPAFLNMALGGTTILAPGDLLRFVKGLEADLGRAAGGVRFGPRLIDIDVLFYDDVVLSDSDLEIPHPRISERAFVLRPLADIAPRLRHPVTGRTVAEMLADAPGRDTVRPSPERLID